VGLSKFHLGFALWAKEACSGLIGKEPWAPPQNWQLQIGVQPHGLRCAGLIGALS